MIRGAIMARGRPPTGAALVDRLDGSPQAKHRLELILRTVAGEISIPQACAELHIGTSRFHQMRTEVLQEALDALEPRPRGRPPTLQSPQEARVEELTGQVQSLKVDLRAAQIREELATVLPTLNRRPEPPGRGGGKKSRRRTRRR
jgi:hypothetical protein